MAALNEPNDTITIDGRQIHCQFVQGKAVGVRREDKTYVYTKKVMNEQRVATHIETHTDFYLQSNDGREQPYRYWGDLPVRDGHAVTAIHLQCGSGQSVWAVLTNQTMRQYWLIDKGASLLVRMGVLSIFHWWWMLVIFLPFLALGLVLGQGAEGVIAFGLVAALGTFACGKVIQWVRATIFWNKLKPKLKTIAQKLLA